MEYTMASDFDSRDSDSQAAKDKSRRTFLHGAVLSSEFF
jgi:hypothetical protein